jgi:hypothetical protein
MTTTLREAAQEFVADYDCGGCGHFAAYAENFRKLLAQQEHEPTVRYKCTVVDDRHPNGVPFEQWVNAPQEEPEPVAPYAWMAVGGTIWRRKTSEDDVPLYTRPPRRESQALTKEDVAQNLRSRYDAAKLLEERRQEIAQPRRETQQEPVAYTGDVARRMREAEMTFHLGMPHAVVMQQMTRFHDLVCAEASIKSAAAFAAPPGREWRGLTMQEINALPEIGGVMWRMGTSHAVVRALRAVEAALKEKNHG